MTHELVKVGRKWAVVTDYGHNEGSGHRSGYWCDDAAGGWGVSNRSAESAVNQCARPVTYPTRKAAEEYIAEVEEFAA